MKLYQKIMVVSFSALLLFSSLIVFLSLKSRYSENMRETEACAIKEHGICRDNIISSFEALANNTPTKWLTNDELEAFAASKGIIKDEKDATTTVRVNYLNATVSLVIYLQGVPFRLTTVCIIENDIPKESELLLKYLLICAVISGGISLVLSFLTYSVFAPLKKIEKTSREIAAGNYSTRLPDINGDFSNTYSAFNDMAKNVESNVGKLSDIASSRKSFADNMAHEMKTPLTSILCMGDLLKLKKDVSEKERRDYAGVIVEEAKRMKELSAKLLTMASTDNSAISPELCSTTELIDELYNAIDPICQKEGIRLLRYGTDGIINVDKELFKTLLANLLDNAIKASSSGQAIVINYLPEGNMMKITVADQGIGMKPEDVRHATEPFYMADKARTRKAGGAGLGLSLCATIARKHDATLDIKSESGQGTAVVVSIPLFDGGTEQ